MATTAHAIDEAKDSLKEQGLTADTLRIKAFPFNNDIRKFVEQHQHVYIIEQNRDAQMRTLVVNELEIDPAKLISITNYDGLPITSTHIVDGVQKHLSSLTKSTQVS